MPISPAFSLVDVNISTAIREIGKCRREKYASEPLVSPAIEKLYYGRTELTANGHAWSGVARHIYGAD